MPGHEEVRGADRSPLAEALGRMASEAPVRLIVRGGCMRPLLDEGQAVEIRQARRYWPGDVVAFPSPAGRLVVHRVIGYRPRRGRLWLQTRADASGTLDPPVAPRRVLGRVLGVAVPARDRLRALWRFGRLWAAGQLPR